MSTNMETYYGGVWTRNDAILLCEACRIGLLPLVRRRLSEEECAAIRPGSVYVWEENSADFVQWIDNKSWIDPRTDFQGFEIFYESNLVQDRSNTQYPGTQDSMDTAASSPSENSASPSDEALSPLSESSEVEIFSIEGLPGDGSPTSRHDVLVKRSFRITTATGQTYHVVAYHNTSLHDGLLWPSADANLEHISPEVGFYPLHTSDGQARQTNNIVFDQEDLTSRGRPLDYLSPFISPSVHLQRPQNQGHYIAPSASSSALVRERTTTDQDVYSFDNIEPHVTVDTNYRPRPRNRRSVINSSRHRLPLHINTGGFHRGSVSEHRNTERQLHTQPEGVRGTASSTIDMSNRMTKRSGESESALATSPVTSDSCQEEDNMSMYSEEETDVELGPAAIDAPISAEGIMCRRIAEALTDDKELVQLYALGLQSLQSDVDRFTRRIKSLLRHLLLEQVAPGNDAQQTTISYLLEERSVLATIAAQISDISIRKELTLGEVWNPLAEYGGSELHLDLSFWTSDQGNREVRIDDLGWLNSGPHYETYKDSVRRFAHNQPQVCEEFQAVLFSGQERSQSPSNKQKATRILAEHKTAATWRDYKWINELFNLNFGPEEIAVLLLADKAESPWIYYDPVVMSETDLVAGFHQQGCAHGMESTMDGISRHENMPQFNPKAVDRLVAEMCGLAGIVPFTTGPPTWNGKAHFTTVSSGIVATVTYGLNLQHSLPRCLDALSRIIILASWLQVNGLIRDKFTFLTQSGKDEVEAVSMPLTLLIDFHAVLNRVTQGTDPVEAVSKVLQTVLTLIFRDLDIDDELNEGYRNNIIDGCALAVQAICVGVAGFSSGHLDEWHPFFMEFGLTEVHFHGAGGPFHRKRRFAMRLTRLSCIGDMLETPVRVFSCYNAKNDHRQHLFASVESLMDLWGPGQMVMDRDSSTEKNICLVEIGDGVIYRQAEGSREAHWKRGSAVEELRDGHPYPRFSREEKLLIGIKGTLATLNTACPIACTLTSGHNLSGLTTTSMLHELGTRPSYWDMRERQLGGQGGNFVFATFNVSWVKNDSETIKKEKLRGDFSTLDLQFLEAPWGVQVSVCTGVAQRVPLREVIADAMNPMVSAWGYRPDEWGELVKVHDIVSKFRSPGFKDWIDGLDLRRRQAVMQIAGYILKRLSYTGFNKNFELVVACPLPQDAFACIHIPCKKQQLWARILKDSEECATFACMTSRCLETDEHKCFGLKDPTWRKGPVLLATAVCQYRLTQRDKWERIGKQTLQNRSTYYMGEPGDEMRFMVRLHDATDRDSPKMLYVWESTIPMTIRQRITVHGLLRDRYLIKLQETRKLKEANAEDVFVQDGIFKLKK